MNLLTADGIYSAYPEALAGFNRPSQEDRQALENRGIKYMFSTRHWRTSCGCHCPAIWRRTEGLRHFGQFRWGGMFRDGLLEGVDPAVRSDGLHNVQLVRADHRL